MGKNVAQTKLIPPNSKIYLDFIIEVSAPCDDLVNMSGKTVTVAQASTLDEDGKRVIAKPKNKFRNRTIKMNKRMRSAIKAQHKLRKKLGIESEYFFCMPDGSQVDRSWLTKDIWKPALEAAGVEYRPLKQARHTYAVMHRSKGEDPLAIAKTLGHCDTTMLEKVYTKYKEKIVGVSVGEEDVVLNDADYGLDGLVDLAGSVAFDVNKSSQKETGIWAGLWAKNKKGLASLLLIP